MYFRVETLKPKVCSEEGAASQRGCQTSEFNIEDL